MALNHSIILDVLNQEETERLVPLFVYLGIIMLTGIPGNILVVVIYRRKAGNSNYQFFVTCLAVVDCITCCILPFVIMKLLINIHSTETGFVSSRVSYSAGQLCYQPEPLLLLVQTDIEWFANLMIVEQRTKSRILFSQFSVSYQLYSQSRF